MINLEQTLQQIPKNWNQITVEQFQELHEVDTMESVSMFDKDIERISIVADIDIQEVESLTAKEIIQFKDVLQFIFKEPRKRIQQEFDFDGMKLKYIGLDSLTLAEFIDLDTFYIDDIINNLHLVAGVLYRQQRLDTWKQPEKEKYNYDTQTRGHLFQSVPITQVYGIASEFKKFHDNFIEQYSGLFPEPQELDEEEVEDSAESRKEKREREIEERQQKKWGWERMVFELSGHDITKIDAVLESNLILTFNQIAMRKELGLN